MKKKALISFDCSLFWAGVLALALHGCGSEALDRRPCAEDFPCPQPAVNACQDQNISSDQWTSLGLENESVTAIAVHPCNPGIIYAGTQRNFSAGIRGKLFKSTDCGQSWDTLVVGGIYSTIQFSPGNPEIIYAVNGGILKSNDSGASWRRANEGIRTDAETGVFSLAINPQNSCELYAGTTSFHQGGGYKSTDAGTSWRQFLEQNVTAIAIATSNPDHIFFGTGGLDGVLRSTDGGKSLEKTGLDFELTRSLLINPLDSDVIYAGMGRDGLHISRNSGKSWEHVSNEFLADTTNVIDLEMDTKNKILYVVTTYGDSGRVLAYNISSDVWKEMPAPVTDKSFYYSKLKIHEFGGKAYIYFGFPSGIYARIEE